MRLKLNPTLSDVMRALSRVDQSTGPDYVSGARAFDFRSSGFIVRSYSLTCLRKVMCFSTGEYEFLLRADFDPAVTDIREQFLWLDLEESVTVAARLGVRHNQRRGVLLPVSCDFLLTLAGAKEQAIEVKYSPRFFDHPTRGKRRREKLELQRAVFLRRGAPLSLVYRNALNPTVTSNLEDLKRRASLLSPPLKCRLDDTADTANRALKRCFKPTLGTLVDRVSASLRVIPGVAQTLVQTCIWNRQIAVDLRHRLLLCEALVRTDAPHLHVDGLK